MSGRCGRSVVVLWVVAPMLLALSLFRPANPSSGRAKALPRAIAGFELVKEMPLTDNHRRLLGTRDVGWRVYADQRGHQVYVTVVFHDANWKSLHPPHICIRGSNFHINSDRSVPVRLDDGRAIDLGHIVASVADRPQQEYVSLFAFVGQDYVTPSYSRYYLSHWFPALLRRVTPGFLLRVEAFVGPDGRGAAERRCLQLLNAYLPFAENLIRSE